MIFQPITCSGNDLASVCADIRLRGGCIEAMDVIGKAMYRVSYFERVAESKDASLKANGCSSRTTPTKYYQMPTGYRVAITGIDVKTRRHVELAGENPAALNHLPKPMHSKNVAAGGATGAEKPKSVPDAPASNFNLPVPVLAKSSALPASTEADSDSRGSGDKAQESTTETLPSIPTGQTLAAANSISISSEWRKHQAAPVGLVGEQVHVAAPVEVVSASAEINPPSLLTSIEDRMAALQSKLLASGKIGRSKPKTEATEFRKPYKDE